MSALVQHVWLLMTLRHSLAGLEVKHHSTLALILIASVAASWLRWDPSVAATHGLVLMFSYALARRYGVAYALLSLGIDLVAFPFENLAGGQIRLFFWWEMVGVVAILFHFARGRARELS